MQRPVEHPRASSGRWAIILAALPGFVVSIGMVLTGVVFLSEAWAPLPFLLSAAVAVELLRLGDRHVKAYEQGGAEPKRGRALDGRLLPTGRRYLSFHASRAGWSPAWCIAVVWVAWAVPVGLVVFLALNMFVPIAR